MNKFNLAWNARGIDVTEAIDDENILKFADGSLRVTIPKEVLGGSHLAIDLAQEIRISAYLQSMDDVMVVAQLVDIIRRHTRVAPQLTLQITSPIYSRYDRVMFDERNDGFGAQTFVRFIKATGVDTVELYDPHSDMIGKLFELHGLKVKSASQGKILRSTLGITDYIRIYPDKGSLNKRESHPAYAPVIFDKIRNSETGKITGIECLEGQGFLRTEQDAPFLIIDDICEGGGTFLGVAKEFWKLSNPANELQLQVTHGLFTNNAIVRLFQEGFFSQVSAYIMKESTYNAIPEEYRERVVAHHIVKGI